MFSAATIVVILTLRIHYALESSKVHTPANYAITQKGALGLTFGLLRSSPVRTPCRFQVHSGLCLGASPPHPAAMATPAKRLQYQAKDLATKVEILKALKDGVSRRDVLEKCDAIRTTLATYVKNENNIMEAFYSEAYGGKQK